MRVCGIICEYDPFHNGHAYHLKEMRAAAEGAYIVCVMSGHFTQRGHAALLSKWARAEMALRCGADAVFELPALFAVRDAERFARGGVALLASLGVVTHIGFGSEAGDLQTLQAMAKIVPRMEGGHTPRGAHLQIVRHENISQDLSASISQGLSQGKTLARARGEALGLSADTPNNTLAVQYLRALDAYGLAITPVTVRRTGHGYHDEALDAFASASAIRQALLRGEDVYGSMPPAAYALLGRMRDDGAVQLADGLDTVLLAMLRTMEPETLSQTADVGEGLENRLRQAAQRATSRQGLLSLVKCKRYTWARLSRVLTQALLGITKPVAAAHPMPEYARLLGFRREAQPLLAAISKSATVPIVTRAAKFRQTGNAAFAIDLRAGSLWALGLENPALRTGDADITHPIIIID